MNINIGLIDDSVFALRLYKEFFINFNDTKVVFSVASIKELERMRKNNNKPVDVVFVDLQLNNERGVDAVQIVKEIYLEAKVIMLTASESENDLMESIHAGANGYLVKSDNLFDLYTAVKKATVDGAFFCSKAAEMLISTIQRRSTVDLDYMLTKREKEMLAFVKQGLSYKGIADKLFVTTFTVNHHMKKVFRKLNVSSKSELISKLWSNEY